MKSIDNNTRSIIVISNFIVSILTLIRVIGAVLTFIKIQERYKGTADEKDKMIEGITNIVLSTSALFLMTIFTLLSAFIRRCEIYLSYSLEVFAILHTVSFPFWTIDYDESILIQYVQF